MSTGMTVAYASDAARKAASDLARVNLMGDLPDRLGSTECVDADIAERLVVAAMDLLRESKQYRDRLRRARRQALRQAGLDRLP